MLVHNLRRLRRWLTSFGKAADTPPPPSIPPIPPYRSDHAEREALRKRQEELALLLADLRGANWVRSEERLNHD